MCRTSCSRRARGTCATTASSRSPRAVRRWRRARRRSACGSARRSKRGCRRARSGAGAAAHAGQHAAGHRAARAAPGRHSARPVPVAFPFPRGGRSRTWPARIRTPPAARRALVAPEKNVCTVQPPARRRLHAGPYRAIAGGGTREHEQERGSRGGSRSCHASSDDQRRLICMPARAGGPRCTARGQAPCGSPPPRRRCQFRCPVAHLAGPSFERATGLRARGHREGPADAGPPAGVVALPGSSSTGKAFCPLRRHGGEMS